MCNIKYLKIFKYTFKLLLFFHEKLIKFFDDYSRIVSEAKKKKKERKLLILFAQVKGGNTSGHLLNEISQISQFICSLYNAKEITKNMCNKIMNSITL